MKAKKECRQCLQNLTLQTINNSIQEMPALKTREELLKKQILDFLEKEFSPKQAPAVIFTKINRKIKKITSVSNPFRKRKLQEINYSRKFIRNIQKNHGDSLEKLLMLSVLGNSLDFFKTLANSHKEISGKNKFSLFDAEKFKNDLKKTRKILFFADNAGEHFFDLPLIKLISKTAKIIYVVKSNPVQNDLTLTDLKNSKLIKLFPKILASGNDAVGIELSTISQKLKKEINSCDLIIAKGMGYYETFSELPEFSGKIYHLLMAKCNPVAKSLNVNLNSYVFIKR